MGILKGVRDTALEADMIENQGAESKIQNEINSILVDGFERSHWFL